MAGGLLHARQPRMGGGTSRVAFPKGLFRKEFMEQKEILDIAMAQSAIDCSCSPEDFVKSENHIVRSAADSRARRYLKLPHIADLVSYGTNVVACGDARFLPAITRYLAEMPSAERCFETPGIYRLNRYLAEADPETGARVYFMAEYFLPDLGKLDAFSSRIPYALRLLGPSDFAGLYLPEWQNALCEGRKHLDVLAVGAYDGERLIGLAGCSADCDSMWQIGIDVLPAYRRQGVASVLTNRLARETLARGKVPFYCAAWSNIKSVKNALKSGFCPAWAEITAKSAAFFEENQAVIDKNSPGLSNSVY